MIPLLVLLIVSLSFSMESALVSVYPFYDVIREIGKGRFRVEVLIPPRADYHHYELTPGDILKVSRASVVFVSGVPLGGWEKKVEELSREKAVSLSKGIRLINLGRIGRDPHVWISPRRMRIVARNAYEGLLKADPEGREIFKRNLERVLKKLDRLDRIYSDTLSRCRIRILPVLHPSLGYIAEDYGLEQIYLPAGHVHGGISPRELLGFVRELEERGVDFIIAVKGSPSKAARVLGSEHGFRVYEINAKIIPAEEEDDYFSIMESNLSVLREALRCM